MVSSPVIYEPSGKAREYAALACNVYAGCDHQCTYCYAPGAVHKTRESFNAPTTRGHDFLTRVERDAFALAHTDKSGQQILLSFTCDPYQSLDVQFGVTRETIRTLHRYGFPVCVLSKGGSRALRDLDIFWKTDAYAATLTTLDSSVSLEWEPGAALPDDRLSTLQAFHAAGIPTWVSLEPVIDPVAALTIIRETAAYVDLFKVGKMNYHPIAQTINWQQFAHDAVLLLEELGKRYLIKEDLKKFL